VQLLKQDLASVSIDEGMQTERSDEHFRNADSPKTEILEPPSNAKMERLRQPLKQDLETILTEEGRQIE
jgi:hypothetical protein